MRHDARVILAASDLSERGAGTITYAARMAARLGRPLLIVHAVEVPDPVGHRVMADRSVERLLRAARQGTAAQARAVLLAHPGLDVRTAVIVGRPADVIVDVARDAFVAVAGAAGRRSGRLLARIPCPVIAVPAGADGIRHGPIVVGVHAGRAGDAGTAFAAALIGSHPSYLVTVHPGVGSEVNLESGALPVDRLVIRVVAPERTLTPAVAEVAAEYSAALVVLERRSPRRPRRSDGAAAVHAVGDTAGCPIALVDPWFGLRTEPAESMRITERAGGVASRRRAMTI